MIKKLECYICHKPVDEWSFWNGNKRVCDHCYTTLIVPSREDELNDKIAELEKALELACRCLETTPFKSKSDKYVEHLIEFYKSKAKEELNNER